MHTQGLAWGYPAQMLCKDTWPLHPHSPMEGLCWPSLFFLCAGLWALAQSTHLDLEPLWPSLPHPVHRHQLGPCHVPKSTFRYQCCSNGGDTLLIPRQLISGRGTDVETAPRGYNQSTCQQLPAPPVHLLCLTRLCHFLVLGSPIATRVLVYPSLKWGYSRFTSHC